MAEEYDNEELSVEDLDLDDLEGASVGALFSEFQKETAEDDGELIELDEPDIRRSSPEFGPLADEDASTRPKLGTAETVFEEDGSHREASASNEAPKSKKGFFGGLGKLKEIAVDEWEKSGLEEDQEEPKPKKVKKEKAKGKKKGGLKAPKMGLKEKLAEVKATAEQEKTKKKAAKSAPPASPDPISAETPAFGVPQTEPTAAEDEEVAPLPFVTETPTDPAPIFEEAAASASFEAPEVQEPAQPMFWSDEDEIESDSETVESSDGIIALVRSRWELARRTRAKEAHDESHGPSGAGLDLTPPEPGLVGILKHRIRGTQVPETSVTSSNVNSNFTQLLTPLSGSDVAILQADLSSDETIFSRIDRSRQQMALRQRIGFLFGIMTVVMFLVANGPSYLIDVLPNAVQPDWIPVAIQGHIAGGCLYALGVLFPILVIFVIADGARLLLSGVGDFRIDDLLLGLSAGICGIGALLACSQGQIISAGIFLVAYLLIQFTARLLGVRGRE